jgi:predicted O-linked N-acetylglucosamine transferase (SPINDLY family)
MLPIFEAHDRAQVEVFCYAHLSGTDEMTGRIRQQAAAWREITHLADWAVAEQIRTDQIDVLVDLAGHTAAGRLLIFARKPAPIQVSYMGYANTTGLSTMDYRLTDVHLDPPGMYDSAYSEQSIRLPETYWCYQPADEAPTVNELPLKTAGRITFSCLNNFCKVTPQAIAVWGRILRRVPASRFVLNAPPGAVRERLLDSLARESIDDSRIEFVHGRPMKEYLAMYHRVDIALDPFPFTGYTTSFDALWMGVPVVSLAGHTAAWRGGVSILSNIGLGELVAQDLQTYEDFAIVCAP